MQFRCAFSEKFHVLKVWSNQFTRELWNRGVLQSLHEWHRPLQVFQFVGRPGHGTLEILAQRIQRLAPCVALIGYEFLKNSDRNSFTVLDPVLIVPATGGVCAN